MQAVWQPEIACTVSYCMATAVADIRDPAAPGFCLGDGFGACLKGGWPVAGCEVDVACNGVACGLPGWACRRSSSFYRILHLGRGSLMHHNSQVCVVCSQYVLTTQCSDLSDSGCNDTQCKAGLHTESPGTKAKASVLKQAIANQRLAQLIAES